jgi:hypothetical protein
VRAQAPAPSWWSLLGLWLLGFLTTGLLFFGLTTWTVGSFWWWTPLRLGILVAADAVYSVLNVWLAVTYPGPEQRRSR